MTSHPLYADEELVARVTDEHLGAGRTVFQVFQLSQDERTHSMRVLQRLQLPVMASVLSLGCGVGGMERYWQDARHDLSFELVNSSQAQLDRCVCEGRRVCADAAEYVSKRGPFDCTVLAYVLGHLPNHPRALEFARRNTKRSGLVVVLDVFDGSPEFDERMCYGTPTTDDVLNERMECVTGLSEWVLSPVIAATEPWVKGHVWPGLFVGRGDA